MTDNEIMDTLLARWQGLDSHNCDPHSFHCDGCERGSIQTPDYLNDDAACDSLLDTLVEKGYLFTLKYTGENHYRWWFEIKDAKEVIVAVKYNRATRREAIVAAVLEVAKREPEADESARLEVARKEAQGE